MFTLKRYKLGSRDSPYDFYELRIAKRTVARCHLEYITTLRGVPRYRLYGVYVPLELRGRGYATLLLYRILHSYRLSGAHISLTSTPVAERLYEHLGFQRVSVLWAEYELQL